MKPIKYPPVGPASLLSPPENPLNTGNPMAPINKYIMKLMVPFLHPKTQHAKYITKLVKEIGTGVNGNGIEIGRP